MKILFWNTNQNDMINEYVASLVQDYNIDVLVMAEYKADEKELHTLFRKNHQNLDICNTLGCDRISVWSSYANVKPGIQNRHYSIQIIQDKFILCCVHLMTDLYGDGSQERVAKIQEIMHEIKEIEEEIDTKQTIVIGDFNEMPYGIGCLNANGLHGLPALDVVDKSVRTVAGVEYRKFYNPMWNFMGDFSYPPGTYYLNQSKMYSPMWYMLDQVILSKDVLPLLNKESLKIITSCSYEDLIDRKRHPNKKISDHFPIMCEIKD